MSDERKYTVFKLNNRDKNLCGNCRTDCLYAQRLDDRQAFVIRSRTRG